MNTLKNVILRKKVEDFSFHPWIYKNHISSYDSKINAGDVVRIISQDNIPLGVGYFNPKSIISLRMLSKNEESIDKKFFINRISEAIKKREGIKKISNAYRIISSEADGLPGLIADSYDNTIVFQITTLGMERFKEEIIYSIKETIKPEFIYEKSDTSSRRIEGLKSASGWADGKGNEEILINENNAEFIVNIVHGHKTGFYLDQRKARIAAGSFAKGKRVLDICCYTGGFAIHSALHKAKKVIACDIKDMWLREARKNALINKVSESVEFKKGDAFDILRDYIIKNEKFDMIILDPPSFVKNKSGIKTAVKGYLELNRMAMRILNEDGILSTFSCSHHVTNEIFSDMLKNAAKLENRTYSILKRCRQDKDHPIIQEIAETEYLKGYFLSLKSI